MFTRILTFLIIVAIIGCVMYGRKIIKTEKVNAVFGNPERAKGGTHWIIVGSSFILLTWIYYSWDIAKSFYPQSANELCQVGKINDSLLALKYLFPIEERESKTASIIKIENKNLDKFAFEVKNSNKISDQNKIFLLGLIEKTKKIIPLLTNESLLDNQTKIKISELTSRIDQLSKEFQKNDYPYETIDQKNKRLKEAQEEGEWGASGSAIENTVEIPNIPKTDKGLKFHTAAKDLQIISDEFFKLNNHNFQYKSAVQVINDEIKKFENEINTDQEITSTLIKDILQIIARIDYASIFPPNSLKDFEESIINFEKVQKNEQGSLIWIDIFLFPAGTIVSSGLSCSEQGTGRWLPKLSDTFNNFILLLKPSVGYKGIPLLWYEMMDASKIVGFILPDWIADIIPGKYPVYNENGTVEPNFKSKTLAVVSGQFSLFKIPIPMGHIWDSFLRVFLGLVLGIIFGVPLGLFMGLNRFAKGFFDPLIELYRPVPPLAWAPLIISVLGIDNLGKIFLLFMVSFSIMIISARAGASGTQLSKIHASHSLGASNWQILRYVIFPNSLPEILTGVRVSIGMCWGTLVAAEFLAGTTGIGFVENVAKKYFQYEVIWISIFLMGVLGLIFDVTLRKIIDKTIPWRGKG